MIAYLSGSVLSCGERNIILNVQGVGYAVHAPRSLAEKTFEGQELNLHIYTNVREDDISLFGFETTQELAFFKLLLTVSGVGPKSALEILNAPIGKIKNAIAKRDISSLTSIQGIGKKTAERIIVDLSGKIKEDVLLSSAQTEQGSTELSEQEEIVQALISLGYHRHQVVQGLKKVPTEIAGEEAIIKYFLQNI